MPSLLNMGNKWNTNTLCGFVFVCGSKCSYSCALKRQAPLLVLVMYPLSHFSALQVSTSSCVSRCFCQILTICKSYYMFMAPWPIITRFWIGWLDLLTHSCTTCLITLNYNNSQSICWGPTPFSFSLYDWFDSVLYHLYSLEADT
jgi:hypothetical protein